MEEPSSSTVKFGFCTVCGKILMLLRLQGATACHWRSPGPLSLVQLRRTLVLSLLAATSRGGFVIVAAVTVTAVVDQVGDFSLFLVKSAVVV